jgi:hypothetical protein
MSVLRFYDKCLGERLTVEDFDFDTNGHARQKLEVLERAVTFWKSNIKVGKYQNKEGVLLKSDIMSGDECFCLGFRSDDKKGFFYPVTLLKENIKNKTAQEPWDVLAIYVKGISDPLYQEQVYEQTSIYDDKYILPPQYHSLIKH